MQRIQRLFSLSTVMFLLLILEAHSDTSTFGLTKQQPIQIGDIAYKGGIFSSCPETCPGSTIYSYIYKGLYQNVGKTNFVFEIQTENFDGKTKSTTSSLKAFPVDDNRPFTIVNVEFKNFILMAVDDQKSLVMKEIFGNGALRGINFFHWDYDKKHKEYLIDNGIRVPNDNERLTLLYYLGGITGDDVSIKLSWYYMPGVFRGNQNTKTLDFSVTDTKPAIMNTPDGGQFYLSIVRGISVEHPLILVRDDSDVFSKYWPMINNTTISSDKLPQFNH